MVEKSFLRSKTFWVNFFMAVMSAVVMMVPAAKPVQDFVTNHLAEIGMVWSILNIILRAVTKDKIVLID